MKNITIKNETNNYEILIDYNAISILKNLKYPYKTLIIYDENVSFEVIKSSLPDNLNYDKYPVKEAENSKNFENYKKIIELLISYEYSRSDLIIGFGGGATLDLAAFVASTYKRGINYISVPSTLLAMVDASIGGKTAINHCGVKNVMGSFYMPNLVICSINLLETLQKRDLASGIMESLKASLVNDKKLYKIIKNADINLIRLNPNLLEEIIIRSIMVKKKIVERDPYEHGIRRYLNLGHTIGHAIEALNFNKITHGESIALGMIPFLANDLRLEVLDVMKNYMEVPGLNLNKDELIKLIKEDKKRSNDEIICVCVDKVGKAYLKPYKIIELVGKIDEICIW